MSPAMSSWVALRRRIEFQPGQSVLIPGATGNAGRMAVQVAKRLGASRVVAVGRGAERLSDLTEADAIVSLDGDPAAVAQNLGETGKDVDVVIDYLWGQPTADAMRAITPRRVDDGQALTWIQIGSSAGLESPIPSAALRAAKLQLIGSGQGSVDTRGFLAELEMLAQEITNGTLTVASRPVPLAEVETAWADTAGSERTGPASLAVIAAGTQPS
jgi:NADPH:quinone reductase-like Zn-dependent oxidoreductase